VRELGCDFLAFSAHKMGGPLGIGVLWGKPELLDAMPPFLTGGEMIDSVTETDAVWSPVPQKFEAGTQDAAGSYATDACLSYLQQLGMDKIEERERLLAAYLCERLQEKDYIASPKENGYRSLHLILRVPIFLSSEKKYMNVEVQFRTIAMDFWASVEHKMKYKREINNAEIIVEELRYSADLINQLDRRMLQIRERIERSEVPAEEEKQAK
jgi:kynureninase